MRLLPVIYLALIVLCSSCAAKHLPLPEPVYGVDIQKVTRSFGGFISLNNDANSYDGIFFSNEYLNDYLQWKCADQGKC